MTKDQAEQMAGEHNVIIDVDTEQYNTNDDLYGWQPIPAEWFEQDSL